MFKPSYSDFDASVKWLLLILFVFYGYSPNYLSKKFKTEIGISISEYIAKEKIDAAKNLLISGDNKITKICDQLGFGSQSYFSELFKKYTGMTPVQYRDKNGSNK